VASIVSSEMSIGRWSLFHPMHNLAPSMKLAALGQLRWLSSSFKRIECSFCLANRRPLCQKEGALVWLAYAVLAATTDASAVEALSIIVRP
jgi:hypothetical protein